MIYRYPQEVHEFVKSNCVRMRDGELAEACNKALGTDFTKERMSAFRSNHGYRNGLPNHITSEEYLKMHYPEGMFEFIRDNSWGVSSKDMAEMVNEKFGMNYTPSMMKQFRQRWGIRSGVTGWYQKGHAPGTKGKTIEEICKHDPEKLARVRSTQFKKGERPANELPLGSIVVNSDGYKLLKIRMKGKLWDRWCFLHRAVWENYFGDIPEKTLVSFKDSDPLNCDPSNLVLMTKSENAVMNRKGLRFEDPDLTMAGLAVVKLNNAVKEKRKRENRRDHQRSERLQQGQDGLSPCGDV